MGLVDKVEVRGSNPASDGSFSPVSSKASGRLRCIAGLRPTPPLLGVPRTPVALAACRPR